MCIVFGCVQVYTYNNVILVEELSLNKHIFSGSIRKVVVESEVIRTQHYALFPRE